MRTITAFILGLALAWFVSTQLVTKENKKLKAENELYVEIMKDFDVYGNMVTTYLEKCERTPNSKFCLDLKNKIYEKTPREEE